MRSERMDQTESKGGQGSVVGRMANRLALLVLSFFVLAAAIAVPAAAEEAEKKSGWQFGADLYMWMPTIGGKTPGGDTIRLEFDDILKDLEFTFMGGVAARNGRWSFTTDVIYMKLKQENNGEVTASIGPRGHEVQVTADATVKLQAWIVTPLAGYTFFDNGKLSADVVAGARYLWLKPELELDTTGPFRERDKTISDSGDAWDGIIGIRGNLNLDNKWYVPYYADIGTGESMFTWQAMAGAGYRISKVVDVVVAYRYLYWKLEENKVLDKLYISGPLVGARFWF